MKKCVPVLLFSVLSASVASHADSGDAANLLI